MIQPSASSYGLVCGLGLVSSSSSPSPLSSSVDFSWLEVMLRVPSPSLSADPAAACFRVPRFFLLSPLLILFFCFFSSFSSFLAFLRSALICLSSSLLGVLALSVWMPPLPSFSTVGSEGEEDEVGRGS
jgi:hypothetical protein